VAHAGRTTPGTSTLFFALVWAFGDPLCCLSLLLTGKALGGKAGGSEELAILLRINLEDGWPDTPGKGHRAAHGVGWSLFPAGFGTSGIGSLCFYCSGSIVCSVSHQVVRRILGWGSIRIGWETRSSPQTRVIQRIGYGVAGDRTLADARLQDVRVRSSERASRWEKL